MNNHRQTRRYTIQAPSHEYEMPWPLDNLAQPRTPWHRLALEAALILPGALSIGFLFYAIFAQH